MKILYCRGSYCHKLLLKFYKIIFSYQSFYLDNVLHRTAIQSTSSTSLIPIVNPPRVDDTTTTHHLYSPPLHCTQNHHHNHRYKSQTPQVQIQLLAFSLFTPPPSLTFKSRRPRNISRHHHSLHHTYIFHDCFTHIKATVTRLLAPPASQSPLLPKL